MTALAEAGTEMDLELLFADNSSIACTSHAVHDCTSIATHIARSTEPCPDQERVNWCDGRLLKHREQRDWLLCGVCKRPSDECWRIYPI